MPPGFVKKMRLSHCHRSSIMDVLSVTATMLQEQNGVEATDHFLRKGSETPRSSCSTWRMCNSVSKVQLHSPMVRFIPTRSKYLSFFAHYAFEEHLGCFQLLTIINSAAVNISLLLMHINTQTQFGLNKVGL